MRITRNITNILDTFIKEHDPCNSIIRSISSSDLSFGKEIYNTLINSKEVISYDIFGSSGYSSYALYKCKNQNIYLIKCYFNFPSEYMKLDKCI